ncbi:MAG: DUF1826 domain-containing protein [Pseudomonadota bacterium]
MNLVREIVQDPIVATSETAPELAAIEDGERAAAIWRRQRPSADQEWLDRLDPSQLPATREVVKLDAIEAAVTRACVRAETPDCAARARLVEDVVMLAGTFSALLPSPYLRLRLDVVQSNACRKFHIDAVRARLICTYRGTGTQYGVAMDGDDPQEIFTVPTGAPIVLKGTLWPGARETGMLHRSPPIAGTGETRLMLVLDPIFDLEDAD